MVVLAVRATGLRIRAEQPGLRIVLVAARVSRAERVGVLLHVHQLAVLLAALVLDHRVMVQRTEVGQREQPSDGGGDAPLASTRTPGWSTTPHG
jgi:hypothetical protein